MSFNPSDYVPWLGVGGLAAAVATLYKLRPQAGQITVVSAEKALVVQTGVLDNLNRELQRMSDRLDAAEAEQASLYRRIDALEADKARLESEAAQLRRENTMLTERVRQLEQNGHG